MNKLSLSAKEDSDGGTQVSFVQGQFIQHSDLIRGFIRSLLSDHVRADDVVQETFLTLTRKAAEFEPGTSFPKWACAVARFKVMEAHRAMRKGGVLLSEEVIEVLAVTENATRTDPRLDRLAECRLALPPSMKRAVDLRYEGDHPPSEIAELMGWKVEAVYVVLSRARSLLRNCLTEKQTTPPVS